METVKPSFLLTVFENSYAVFLYYQAKKG